ncbi:hypothetical protein CASFOL_027905 [Castilleja foliolosa]|uniref:F-box associated beta-propeller type 1 domain-containing protein n=1 Tax=Castilleja foliolosa TaxID=1961234 RepID=A0ABD3CH57_9LAMI
MAVVNSMLIPNKGNLFKVSEPESISFFKLRPSPPPSLYIPKKPCHPVRACLQQENVIRHNNKLLLRRLYRGEVNPSGGYYFSMLSTDDNNNNGPCFPLEKNYDFETHKPVVQNLHSKKWPDIAGSCNGIVCLAFFCGNNVLWNPVTDELKSLPPSSIECPSQVTQAYFTSGFGFDARSGDYKVVRCVFHYTDMPGEYTKDSCQYELYSLKSDSWRPIPEPGKDTLLHASSTSLNNGSLYWPLASRRKRLLSFDFADEVFSFLPLPINTEEFEVKLFDIDDGSNLGLIAQRADLLEVSQRFDLWVCETKEWCWSKVDSFVVEEARFMLGLWGRDKCFFQGYNNQLLLFDRTTRELKSLGIKDFPMAMKLVPFVETTVPIKPHSKQGTNNREAKKKAVQTILERARRK